MAKATSLKVILINTKTKDLKIVRGAKWQDPKDKVWKLKVFGEPMDPLPLPKEEAFQGHYTSGGFMQPKRYVLLGTRDDKNYFYMKQDNPEKIKILPEDTRKWSIMSFKDTAERFQAVPNWQKVLMYSAPLFATVILFAGILLFIFKGIPELQKVVGNIACNCAFNVTQGMIPPPI